MAIGRNANRPQGGGISDPDPKLNPPRLSKTPSEALKVS